MTGSKECIHMTIEEFKKEHEGTANIGFKHGADMVLKMVKMLLPKDTYDSVEWSVHSCSNYKDGKQNEDEANAWAARKEKEFGYER
jgi:hypothetical protein